MDRQLANSNSYFVLTEPFVDEAKSFLLSAGFEPANLVTAYRYTWRSSQGLLTNSQTALVGFIRPPHTMRTACISVLDTAAETTIPELIPSLTFLSAPVALVATPTAVGLWSIRRDSPSTAIQQAPRSSWQNAFRGRLSALAPDALFEAKQGLTQLDLVDSGLLEWAEEVTSHTLITLLHDLLTEALLRLSESKRRDPSAQQTLVRLVFQLFACRVLEDHGVIAPGLSVEAALQAAHSHFSENIDPEIVRSPVLNVALPSFILDRLRTRFAFASLTTEMLGHAYENALITPEFRKKQGVYYTPSSVTRYILSRLPIESIPPDDRFLLDPSCGSGSFLLAGFERLASLLPESSTPKHRHDYLRKRLLGLDTDPFAREVASLSLLLTDLHNRNGWQIREADATSLSTQVVGRPPTIITTNPPFKELKAGGVRRELAAEIFVRLIDLLAVGGLLGIVLPQSILESRSGRQARARVLDECDLLEVATLPGGLFHSNADTAVMLLRKRLSGSRGVSALTTIRELRSQDLGRFEQLGMFTHTYSAESETWRQHPERRFTISPLASLWARLETSNEPLRKVAEVRTGLQIKSTDADSVSKARRAGYVRFVDRLTILRPYLLLTEAGRPPLWLRYGPHLHRPRDRRIFETSKVLVNSNRNPGSPWRLVAAPAPGELFFSLNFHAIIPFRDGIPLEQIAAVLNSPVANAWLDARSRGRWIATDTLEALPFPAIDKTTARHIQQCVQSIQSILRKEYVLDPDSLFVEDSGNPTVLSRLYGTLDDIVYDAYRLTRAERFDIDKLMRAGKRPR